MKIEVYNNNVIKAYKKLNKKLHEDGMYKKLKEKQFYKPPSLKRREKHELAVLRLKKIEVKRQQIFEKKEKQIIRNSKTNKQSNTSKPRNSRQNFS